MGSATLCCAFFAFRGKKRHTAGGLQLALARANPARAIARKSAQPQALERPKAKSKSKLNMNQVPNSAVRPQPTPSTNQDRLNDDEEQGCGHDKAAKTGGGGFLERTLVDSRTLLVSGPVSDEMAQHVASRLIVMERLDPERPITVMINSPGGSADAGFAIYDMLRFVTPPIRTVVNGLCASAAILILLATDKKNRFSLPESRFLIHQPSTTGHGTASDLDITAREILKLRERYNKIIAETTGQQVEKVLADARRDFWLNAKESLDYGLVCKILKKRSDMPA